VFIGLFCTVHSEMVRVPLSAGMPVVIGLFCSVYRSLLHRVHSEMVRVPLSAGMPVVIGLFYGIIGLFYIEYTPRWCVCLCRQVCSSLLWCL